jgi:hypothetical protein
MYILMQKIIVKLKTSSLIAYQEQFRKWTTMISYKRLSQTRNPFYNKGCRQYTLVQWVFKENRNDPFSLMRLYVDIDEEDGRDFGTGILNLEAVLEKQ